MLDAVDITFSTPSTPSELAKVEDDFILMARFVPTPIDEGELRGFLRKTLGCNTLVYANGILIACFMLAIHKRTVELHGSIRPDMHLVVPDYKGVKRFIQHVVLDGVFNVMKKDKVIIKAEPTNKGVRGFALMWGFQRLPNVDKGRYVWKLARDKFNGKV